MSYTILKPAIHEEWLEERSKGICSSEVGTIMGVNRFDTPYRLWRRTVDIDGPVESNETMEVGHLLDPVVVSVSDLMSRRLFLCTVFQFFVLENIIVRNTFDVPNIGTSSLFRRHHQRKHVRGIQMVIPLVHNCGIGKDGHPVAEGSV